MTAPLLQHRSLVVSVPCFNEERWLLRTLESLRDQTLQDFGVLITDNASTDRTENVARAFCEQDARFRYVRHPTNLGAVENFNSGRALTESPYLIWVGGHDILAPEALAHHIAVLEARPDVSVSQSAHAWIDVDDRFMYRLTDGDLDFGGPDDATRYLASIGRNSNNIGANSVIRRAMLDDAWFTEVVATDRVVLSHLAFRGRFADTPEILYFRRSFDRSAYNPYMERLTGRPDAVLDWGAMAQAYDADFTSLLGSRVGAKRLRRRLQLLLRYHLPVGLGTPLTMVLWTLRRARKWSTILWTRSFGRSSDAAADGAQSSSA